MRDIAVALRPHAWVNVHSGMEGLFMPYDHVARMPDGADAAASLAVLQELNRTACGGRCVVGSGGESVGCCYIAWRHCGHYAIHQPLAVICQPDHRLFIVLKCQNTERCCRYMQSWVLL